MAHERIVVIEDDKDIQALLKERLADEQFEVLQAFSGEEGIALSAKAKPELVLLDIMLPGKNGFDILRSLKVDPLTKHVPVIMLTARSDEADVVSALELGADDYVTKPFSFKILAARVRRLLRVQTVSETPQAILRYGSLEADRGRFLIKAGERQFELSATEFAIVCLFMEQPGRVFTRSQIITRTKGEDYPVTDRTIDVHITSLRKKLGAYLLIETIRGIGYRLKEDV